MFLIYFASRKNKKMKYLLTGAAGFIGIMCVQTFKVKYNVIA